MNLHVKQLPTKKLLKNAGQEELNDRDSECSGRLRCLGGSN